jgi:hypothetical protein
MESKAVTYFLLVIFVLIVILSLVGLRSNQQSAAAVQASELPARSDNQTLFVLIHGLKYSKATWADIVPALNPHNDTVTLDYDSGIFSNADPDQVATTMVSKINEIFEKNGVGDEPRYQRIRIVGFSLEALIARKAYLIAARANAPWVSKVDRIILLAGMNRGWDITGVRPMDMGWDTRLQFLLGTWFGRLVNRGTLIRSAELGEPFVADLRLDWLEWFRLNHAKTPVVVQLLGDIDDIVSDADNKDLRAAAGADFYWLRVQGTGHGDIVDFHNTADAHGNYRGIGPYRREKFLLAATGTVEEIQKDREELPFEIDASVTQIVFVLHGIRDLGRWSAAFEEQLNAVAPLPDGNRRMIVSARYGFFSMASFIFRADRQKFVRWFMDHYTETRANYPNATDVDFIGHSNGTYLLASALREYASLKIRRVAFAGSVVPMSYPWSLIAKRGQVGAFRNYMGSHDAVVAPFPRFFESPLASWMGNDVGSGGFNQFNIKPTAAFDQVVIPGGHSAFEDQIPQIGDFIEASHIPPGQSFTPTRAQAFTSAALNFTSRDFFWVVWVALIFVIGFPATRIAVAGGQYAWIALAMYSALVWMILTHL